MPALKAEDISSLITKKLDSPSSLIHSSGNSLLQWMRIGVISFNLWRIEGGRVLVLFQWNLPTAVSDEIKDINQSLLSEKSIVNWKHCKTWGKDVFCAFDISFSSKMRSLYFYSTKSKTWDDQFVLFWTYGFEGQVNFTGPRNLDRVWRFCRGKHLLSKQFQRWIDGANICQLRVVEVKRG